MKCPFKFRLLQFEGGEECDPECAWRAGDTCAIARKPIYVVKLAGIRRNEELVDIARQAKSAFGDEKVIVIDNSVEDVYAAERCCE